jgi:gamma-glutamyltranspeptidase/glutathione hydrolase
MPRAAVASPHYLASAAGFAALARGGNAMDAVVAANLALGVVAPYLCGYGGDVFAIVWDGELHGYLGSGTSPAAITVDHVAAQSNGGHMPVFGAHTVTVPGAVRGWFDLLDRWGTRSFGDLAEDAVRFARDGFEVTPGGGRAFDESRAMYRGFDAWNAVYGDARSGTTLRQPAMARLIELLAAEGADAYYRGEVADAIAATIQVAGGTMTSDDLAAHAGEWAPPLLGAYRGNEIAELPPPTQGVTVLEAMRILDGADLPDDAVGCQHVLIEALKQALADRDHHVTDPAGMTVAADDLLAEEWVTSRRAAIRPDRAVAPEPGIAQPGGTAYLCAADADGLLVSLIQSNFVHCGSGVHVPEWGINLNNRGFSFSLDPTRANVLAPRKRPLHTLVPAMALRDGAPWLVFGSMGGDAQAGVHVQLLAHVIDARADIADAIDAPRWRIDPGSWRVHMEARFPSSVVDGLRDLGHRVDEAPRYDVQMGHAHAIRRTANGYGVTFDPRSEGSALGF